jgi:hypothetical protein
MTLSGGAAWIDPTATVDKIAPAKSRAFAFAISENLRRVKSRIPAWKTAG